MESRAYQLYTAEDHQASFASRAIPYYLHSLERSVSKIHDLPAVSKEILSQISPYDLLPKSDLREEQYLQRTTGGTTGCPLPIFYSTSDWHRAIELHVTRFSKAVPIGARAFNLYNQAHISGPIFTDALRSLGAFCFNRSAHSSLEEVYSQIKKNKCNVLLTPSQSASHKGYTLEALLDVDSMAQEPYINGSNIQTVIVSSSLLTEDLVEELTDLGITKIINCYGLTELMPIAFSCPLNPHLFHVVSKGVAINEDSSHSGQLVVSRIGDFHRDGSYIPSTSTSILRYHTNDKATFLIEPCKCGHYSLSFIDISRGISAPPVTTGCQEG